MDFSSPLLGPTRQQTWGAGGSGKANDAGADGSSLSVGERAAFQEKMKKYEEEDSDASSVAERRSSVVFGRSGEEE